MKLDIDKQLSPITKMLHWLVAIAMIALLAVGVYMVQTETRSLYSLHKSFGFLILFLAFIRVIWRIKDGWLTPAGNYTQVEQLLSKMVHWVLLLGTLMMPISGLLMSTLGGHGINLFGLEIMARNMNPDVPGRSMAYNESLASLFHSAHHWIAYIIIGAIVLHIIGALKHHLIDKDETLNRMVKW